MVLALFVVLYAMRELRQPNHLMKANSSSPLFLLFGNPGK